MGGGGECNVCMDDIKKYTLSTLAHGCITLPVHKNKLLHLRVY